MKNDYVPYNKNDLDDLYKTILNTNFNKSNNKSSMYDDLSIFKFEHPFIKPLHYSIAVLPEVIFVVKIFDRTIIQDIKDNGDNEPSENNTTTIKYKNVIGISIKNLIFEFIIRDI